MVSLVVFLCRGFSFVFGVGDGEWVRGFQSVCRHSLCAVGSFLGWVFLGGSFF